MGYKLSSQLTATINLCPIYLKRLVHVLLLYDKCSYDFKVNQIKIKGGCQLGSKMVTHNSKSDLPLEGGGGSLGIIFWSRQVNCASQTASHPLD